MLSDKLIVSVLTYVVLPDTVKSPVTTRLPSKVSSSSDLKNCVESIPSKKSASRPEPAPSTVLIRASKSSGSALNSTILSVFAPASYCLMYILPSAVFIASSPNDSCAVVGMRPATALLLSLINVDICMSFYLQTYKGYYLKSSSIKSSYSDIATCNRKVIYVK